MSDKDVWGLIRRGGLNILLALLLSALFSTNAAALASQTPPQSVQAAANDELSRMYQLVYDGRFDELDTLISQTPKADKQPVLEIAAIAREYDELEQRREQAKGKSYQEKWNRLQAMKWADANEPNTVVSYADVNFTDIPLSDTADIFLQWVVDENLVDLNDALAAALKENDANSVKEPAEVFSLASSLNELAEPQQKEEILNAPIVNQAIERAITAAQKYESQGKWFDSYSNAWYWLSILDKDNKQYKEHAEELVEKATILSTFQDSPCETSRQRFERVEPSMYKRAIEVIDTTYVNPMFIDYNKMSEKIIRRAKLMAEVIDVSYDQIEESYKNNGQKDAFEMIHRPDSGSLKAWNEALDALASDIKLSTEGISRERYLNLFDQILVLNSMTVSMPKSILIAQMTQASFSVLDPHTMIVWPQDVEDFKKDLTGEFSGIGIIISKDKGLLTAASLLPDTPAYKSGLDAGDIIEAVDGVPTKDMSLECAVKYITGAAGTTVNLTIRTPGEDKSRELAIVRAKIVVQTIRGWQRTTGGQWKYMLDDERKIGYVRLTSFSDNTADEFEEALDRLEKQGMQALVLDLRFNPGGLLDSAVAIADKFIRRGLIVRTQPRWGIPDYRSATGAATHPDYPLVILVNQYSASASEIVAGALQDEKYQRAVIVGDRTHGKGSVQQVSFRPGGGAQLKYTIAYYHLPSGQRVESREDMEKLGCEDWGITPDVMVKLTNDELSKLTDIQRDNDVLVKADHDVGSAPLNRHSLDETLEADPQLKVALLVIRTKLLEQGRAVASLN